jgi:hypothetical protein
MRNPRSGFALLFVLAMAAVIAVMLYTAMPRVAFEAQRDKEQLLIDRGEQYSRAVNLFVRKFNRYPADFDALQNTQNLRFLRKQYVDPFTGKQEWRLIHVGPGGVFTDSLVYGKKTDDATKEQQTFITEMQQIGGNPVDPNAPSGVNLATRQRPSDQPGAPGSNPGAAGGNNFPPPIGANGQPILTPPAAATPGTPGASPVANPFPSQFDANGQPVQNSAAGGNPLSPVPLPAGIGLPPGAVLPPGIQQPGQQQPQQQPNAPPTSAADMINQLLTSPRPGGLPGFGGAQVAGAAGAPVSPTAAPTAAPAAATATTNPQTIGGGIAGVASKLEQKGIKLYKDKKKYNEWEFVYDISKDPTRSAVAPAPAANANGAAAPGATSSAATTTAPGTSPTTVSTTSTPPPPPPPPPPTQ